jgi:GAF domain-containing protein
VETAIYLRQLLDQAIKLDRAVKATVQIYEPDTDSLRIIAHRGFNDAFLRHFENVKRFDSSTCGRAFGIGSSVLVADIMTDEAFTPYREVALANGIRSVKSIPVVGTDDQILGVLSTHSATIRWDWERDNTRHIAAEIACILSELRPVQKTA